MLREQSEGTIPSPPLSSPPASLLSFSCSFSCLGHHVLRHPATTASPLHTYRGGRKREGEGNEGGSEGRGTLTLTHTHAHLATMKRLRKNTHTHFGAEKQLNFLNLLGQEITSADRYGEWVSERRSARAMLVHKDCTDANIY